jgi:hypothetical protein
VKAFGRDDVRECRGNLPAFCYLRRFFVFLFSVFPMNTSYHLWSAKPWSKRFYDRTL